MVVDRDFWVETSCILVFIQHCCALLSPPLPPAPPHTLLDTDVNQQHITCIYLYVQYMAASCDVVRNIVNICRVSACVCVLYGTKRSLWINGVIVV